MHWSPRLGFLPYLCIGYALEVLCIGAALGVLCIGAALGVLYIGAALGVFWGYAWGFFGAAIGVLLQFVFCCA